VDLVERVGSYLGLASFLGLAVLALLYFSQGRDVRRLREWAGRAPERAVEQAERAAEGERATEVAPATPAAAAAHSLPPTPLSEAQRPRKRLRERIRNIHIPDLRYVGLTALGILVLAGGAYGAIQLTDDEGDGASSPEETRDAVRERDRNRDGRQSANVDPSQVTVAVLNGTTVQGLAAQLGEEVRSNGFKVGTIGNAARIDQAASEVLYRDGETRAARAVANRLGIERTAPVDSVNEEIAGSFDVIVLVGSDRSG
jgi:LytR cell envelope-related transcriptional attenuator